MPTVIRMVCLANSRMPGGSCIAGRVLKPGGRPGPWVRPVSGHGDKGVPPQVACYPDGGTPRLPDVMDVPVLRPDPKGHQQENWLIDESRNWTKVGTVKVADLSEWIDAPETLWINGFETSVGLNNRVKPSDADSLDNSLYLIKVDLTIRVLDQYDSAEARIHR